jgi:uncharacterized BrkB/YihY/UPF0761 family membrane protein
MTLPLLLIWPADPGTLSSGNLIQFYGVTLQSFLTLIGLVFTLGLFIAGTRQITSRDLFQEVLRGFLTIFIIVSLLTVLGMITLKGDVDISRRLLNAPNNLLAYNSFSACLLFLILSLLCASITFLGSVFVIFVDSKRHRPSPTRRAARKQAHRGSDSEDD